MLRSAVVVRVSRTARGMAALALLVVCVVYASLVNMERPTLGCSDRQTPLIPPVPCRDDLSVAAQKWFSVTARAAEVGVFKGLFAAKNLKHWSGDYYLIDAWQYREDDAKKGKHGGDKNFASNEVNVAHMEGARKNALAAAGPNSTRIHLIRDLSVSAASRFPDQHFDWLYIDAMHDYENVLNDLEAWWPKLRPGGLFSGDDYGDFLGSPLMSAERFSTVFGSVAVNWKWGVQRAVNEFCERRRLVHHVTWANDCYQIPAWYIIKPLSCRQHRSWF